jgi:hypothetical protein
MFCTCLQVTGTLLKGYKARFKGAPISSTVDYYKQYVSASRLTAEGLVFETKPLNSGYGGMGCSGLNAVWCPAVP